MQLSHHCICGEIIASTRVSTPWELVMISACPSTCICSPFAASRMMYWSSLGVMLSRLATLLDTTVLVQPVSGMAPTLRVALESFVDSHRSRGGVAMPVLALAALHQTISGSPLLFWDWFSFFASLVSSVACFANCGLVLPCLLYTSPSPRDLSTSRMPSSA